MKFTALILALVITGQSFAQQSTKPTLYHPEENAAKQVDLAIKKAASEKKHVILQVGGNWCSWCIKLDAFVKNSPKLDSLVKTDYVIYHLNYSNENKNLDLLAKYGYPQRFGFPVLLILDEKGKLIHTQNSAYLEEGSGYNTEKVAGFLRDWSPKAFDPSKYK